MIYMYTGTPGSGKSLHVAREMQKWMSLYKSPVIGNFDFNVRIAKQRGYGGYLKLENDEITPEFLIWFSEKYRDVRKWERVPEETILLVLDECQLIFNAREWNDKNRKSWVSFFTQHRKLGYRVILICQFSEMIDKQIRALIEYEYIHRKMKNIGVFGFLLNTLALGGLHIAVKRYAPLKEKVGQEFFKANRYLFALYDSYNRFSSEDAGVDPRDEDPGRQLARVK